MDYSLLVGIHDRNMAETEQQNDSFENDLDNEGDDNEDDEDSPGSANIGGGGGFTPPDSPMVTYHPPAFFGELDSALEFFAIRSSERE